MDRKLVDLSHEIRDGMITYPGLPSPTIRPYLSHEDSRNHYGEGTVFHIGRLEMVANTGTYLDAPFHRFPEREDMAALTLDRVANLEGLCVSVPPDIQAIGAEIFTGLDVKNKAILVHTGWDRHFGTKHYFENHPHLTEEAALLLRDGEAHLVGIDSLNIDGTTGTTRPVHTHLLAAGIPIVEHLRGLGALPEEGFRFFAVPVKFQGLGSFPVRAFAIVT